MNPPLRHLNFARKLATKNVCQLSWGTRFRKRLSFWHCARWHHPDRIRNLINAQVHRREKEGMVEGSKRDLHLFLARFELKIEILLMTKKTETSFARPKVFLIFLWTWFNEYAMRSSADDFLSTIELFDLVIQAKNRGKTIKAEKRMGLDYNCSKRSS